MFFSLLLLCDSGIALYDNSGGTALKTCVALSAMILTLESWPERNLKNLNQLIFLPRLPVNLINS